MALAALQLFRQLHEPGLQLFAGLWQVVDYLMEECADKGYSFIF
jgi:hypothetical protein